MSKTFRILVVGCGQMGTSHARAYHQMPSCEIVGLVSRGPESRERLSQELGGIPTFGDYYEALAATRPDAVCISTYPETHVPFALAALEQGAHVFVEKPLAETVTEATKVRDLALSKNLKVVVGYILRQHPAWTRFTEIARTLGKPLVMRMNLNQQSSGQAWEIHKNLMKTLSPIVDCGVHYVDVMCQMTRSRPTQVYAIGARLSEEIDQDMYNYGQLQVRFEDGSVGWYEAGWGPMMSEEAFFLKDVIGPKGSISIAQKQSGSSADVNSHTVTQKLLMHRADRNEKGEFIHQDEWISTKDEPDHDGLCLLEQQYFLKAIQENLDLRHHLEDAINSLKIVLAADRSIREGRAIDL